MELRHLRYFVAVAEELHFGRAAARVGIAQPALTKQIQSLEGELGVGLLCRNKRRVELTEAGRLLLAEARPLLDHAALVERTARRAAQGTVGRLGVGFTPVALYGALPPILRTFRERFAGVDLALHELWTPELVEALVSKRLQVGVVRLPIAADLATLTLRHDPLVVALPAGHWLAHQATVALANLAEDRFILFPRHLRPDFYDELVGLCRTAGFTPQIGQEATTEPTMIGLVAAGLGVTLVPAAYRSMKRADLVYRSLAESAPTVETVLAWRRDDPSPALRAFVDVARELATATAGGDDGSGAIGNTARRPERRNSGGGETSGQS